MRNETFSRERRRVLSRHAEPAQPISPPDVESTSKIAGGPDVAADTLWTSTGDVFVGAPLQGTILAPNASVVVDTAGDFAALVGAIYARKIEVHQGKQIRHRPFRSSWSPAFP
jgi:hypothetical protein